MFEFTDPKTFWLNVTNAGLGLVCLACLFALGQAVVQDIRLKMKSRATVLVPQDDHSLLVPELGLTMADGGEKLPAAEKQEKQS